MTAPLLDGLVIEAESPRAATRRLFGGGNDQAAASRHVARSKSDGFVPHAIQQQPVWGPHSESTISSPQRSCARQFVCLTDSFSRIAHDVASTATTGNC